MYSFRKSIVKALIGTAVFFLARLGADLSQSDLDTLQSVWQAIPFADALIDSVVGGVLLGFINGIKQKLQRKSQELDQQQPVEGKK